ncbi:hypothetical protein [Streptomyces sp. NPDC052225]|uniref:hypothetical protein n=1 Tax=Streptomyces sp. NPDC052225 TaxID=3154949 RepID=UPI003442965B
MRPYKSQFLPGSSPQVVRNPLVQDACVFDFDFALHGTIERHPAVLRFAALRFALNALDPAHAVPGCDA